MNSVFNINTINSVNENISGTGIVNNLYSNILAINNNNTRRSTNDIMEVCTSPTSNYLYYNIPVHLVLSMFWTQINHGLLTKMEI